MLSIPRFYDPKKVGEIYPIPYQDRFTQAIEWANNFGIGPSASDAINVELLVIDAQNSFCLKPPYGELYVGGRSGEGAIEDNDRLCRFIYGNLDKITGITASLDTHFALQIFYPTFWINDAGEHPTANTTISKSDVDKGVWKVDPAMVALIRPRIYDKKTNYYTILENYTKHYVNELTLGGRYELYLWPFHTMLGSVGHALVSAVGEAMFFHGVARKHQTDFMIKGGSALTENYSVLGPEVLMAQDGKTSVGQRNTAFFKKLVEADMMIIAGQAKSHCVRFTIHDLLNQILANDPKLAKKVRLLEDCTSSVVIPGVVDFTQQGDDAFEEFRRAGMHVVKSTDPIEDWPDSPFKK